MIIMPCCKCGDRAEIYGFDSEGGICRDCAPRQHCHECQRVWPVEQLSDDGGGRLMCEGCLTAIAAMLAQEAPVGQGRHL